MTNNHTDGKLQYITTIYGHLYIRNTNTSRISFPALERILVSDVITPTCKYFNSILKYISL